MAFTLQNLLVEGYKRLGQLTVSKATGGTTNTIVDSNIEDEEEAEKLVRKEVYDYYNSSSLNVKGKVEITEVKVAFKKDSDEENEGASDDDG